MRCRVFFFNDTATTEIYTLSLHDALPIYVSSKLPNIVAVIIPKNVNTMSHGNLLLAVLNTESLVESMSDTPARSEEHTSELQSRQYLVCRLLLEKKKKSPHRP